MQARGKAIRRAQAVLPILPWQKLCVVEFVAKQVGLNVESSPVSTHNCGGLSSKTRNLFLPSILQIIFLGKFQDVRTGSL